MVSIGTLFAIHQAGVLSFARTWPLLVIVIGVMKLLERTWAPAPPQPAGYPNPAASYPYARQTPPVTRSQQSPGSLQNRPPNVPPGTPGGTSL